jgi:hypothetical protein
MRISRVAAPFLVLTASLLTGPVPSRVLGQSAAANDQIDPLALDIVRAVTDGLKNAKAFSFQATVAKERLGTNGQIVTLFRRHEVTVSRPNKMRLNILGASENVDVYYEAANVTLAAPDKKLYTSVAAGDTLDKVVDGLEARQIEFPLSPLLRSDPYKALTDGLESADVIGRVTLEGRTFHHLVFTEKDADWQLWVEGGAKPTVRRVEIVYKNMPREPRITIDFANWNLSATPAADFFTYHKPADAKAISFLTAEGGAKK